MEAVKQNGHAINFVSKAMCSHCFALSKIRSCEQNKSALQFIDEGLT